MTCSHRLNLLAVLLLLCLTGCVSDVEFDHEDDETTSDPSTLTNPLSSLGAIEVYWNREANGTYALRALAPASVAKVEYRVDGHLIAAPARQGSKDNFPASYRFSQEGTGRAFEVKGLDAKGKTVALGVGAIDVTAGTAFYIKQMGRGLFEVGLERGPQGVAAVEVEVDGRWVLTDQVTGRQRSDRMAVRSLFGGIGPRTFALKTYGSDGRLRGTITRQFDLSGGRATPQPPSVACSGTPAIVSRSSWGARSYRGGTSSLGRPTRITIHHEGAGVSRPASTRGAQAMRDTQAFHQNGNGWADLGYHYVIMPDGGHLPRPRHPQRRPGAWVSCLRGELEQHWRHALWRLLPSAAHPGAALGGRPPGRPPLLALRPDAPGGPHALWPQGLWRDELPGGEPLRQALPNRQRCQGMHGELSASATGRRGGRLGDGGGSKLPPPSPSRPPLRPVRRRLCLGCRSDQGGSGQRIGLHFLLCAKHSEEASAWRPPLPTPCNTPGPFSCASGDPV